MNHIKKYLILFIFLFMFMECENKNKVEYSNGCEINRYNCKDLSCLECIRKRSFQIESKISYWNRTNSGILSGDTYKEGHTYEDMYNVAKFIECPQCDEKNLK